MVKKYFSFLILFFLCLTPSLINGQEHPGLLKWFDSQIGLENSRLLNGTAYNERHRILNNKNKLFQGNAGTGSVLYDGHWFTDLQMRYNIFDDALIVQLETTDGLKIVQLVRDKVERFTLHGSTFANFQKVKGGRIGGFYEILFEEDRITLVKKHARKINEKRDRQVSYYEFEPVDGHYAFTYQDDIYLLGNRNDLEKIFPSYRDEIRAYYRNNRSVLRSRPDSFYISLFRELVSLENEKRKPVLQ